MKKEQYEHIENTLRELALYIRNARIEEEKENFKKLFYVVQDNVAPLRNKTVDSNKSLSVNFFFCCCFLNSSLII